MILSVSTLNGIAVPSEAEAVSYATSASTWAVEVKHWSHHPDGRLTLELTSGKDWVLPKGSWFAYVTEPREREDD